MHPMLSRAITTFVVLIIAGQALADTLPLRHGAYVAVGTSCDNPPNVALRSYDGNGIGSSKANRCRAAVRSRPGNRFDIIQDCEQFGGPISVRETETLAIRINGPTTYTDLSAGINVRYRLCPNLAL
jgi:hypothetical protein